MSSWREPQSRTQAASVSPEFSFLLDLKKRTKSGREDLRTNIGTWKPRDASVDLPSFTSSLRRDLGLSGDFALSWVDSDGDELPIGSECEFQEAVKSQRKKNKNVRLTIEAQKLGEVPCEELFTLEEKSEVNLKNMAPIVMNDLVKGNRSPIDMLKNGSASSALSSEALPPVWFRSYMETMKNEIVREVSAKVMADVMGILDRGQSEPRPSCSQSATPRSRNLRESNTEEKQQHRKKKKRVVEEVESSDTFSPPQQMDVALLRKVKKIEKRERHLQRKLDHKLERLEQMTRIVVETKNRCHAVIAKSLDKKCTLDDDVALPAASAPPQDTQAKEFPSSSTISIGASFSDSRPRMNCSVTGHEMLEKTANKEVAYESDSDSDNISIISGISNVSDIDDDCNFEMIQTPPCFDLDKPLNNEDSKIPKVQEKLDNSTPNSPEKQNLYNVVCEGESDRNNNRDSPSYEVLSGPASSASSIHLDEDHFHSPSATEQIVHSDLIDLNHDDPETKKGSAFVVDTRGKIFEKNIVQERKESTEIHLDKRPGGAYAFVNETLPIHTIIDASQTPKSETSDEEFNGDNCNLNSNMKNSHSSYESEAANCAEKSEPQGAQSQSQSNYETREESASAENHESSRSFSYRTSRGPITCQGRDNVRIQVLSESGLKYRVVDHNVSKGLGTEIKFNSQENNLGARGCQAKREEKNGEGTSGVKYQRGFTSEGAGCVFTEQPQKSSPEDGTRESSPDFGRSTNDSVHILPETLVSGAVTLASSAYSTARKAFDRIRNIQTGENDQLEENEVTIEPDDDTYFGVLQEMGFTDVDLNARLLEKYNYDMSRVIGELVQ